LEATESYANALCVHQSIASKSSVVFYFADGSSEGSIPPQALYAFYGEMEAAIRKADKDKLMSALIHLSGSLSEQSPSASCTGSSPARA
jgi:hypothetical protein